MLITVTNTTTYLYSLLTAAGVNLQAMNVSRRDKTIVIQNDHPTIDIFVDAAKAPFTTGSGGVRLLATGGVLSDVKAQDLSDIHLVTASGTNANVRVFIN